MLYTEQNEPEPAHSQSSLSGDDILSREQNRNRCEMVKSFVAHCKIILKAGVIAFNFADFYVFYAWIIACTHRGFTNILYTYTFLTNQIHILSIKLWSFWKDILQCAALATSSGNNHDGFVTHFDAGIVDAYCFSMKDNAAVSMCRGQSEWCQD